MKELVARLGFWDDETPQQLVPAVGHVRTTFISTLEQCLNATAEMCAAKLYNNSHRPIDKYNAALLQQLTQPLLPTDIGKFHCKLEIGTPGAIIAAYYGLLVAVAQEAIVLAFDDLLEIATKCVPGVEPTPLAWTKRQLAHLARDSAFSLDRWVWNACIDRDNWKLSDEFWWDVEKWRAPGFIRVACCTQGEYQTLNTSNRPIDPWKRVSIKQTESCRLSMQSMFVCYLDTTAKNLSGKFAARVAKQSETFAGDSIQGPESCMERISRVGQRINYRSGIKRAILVQLTKDPLASDLTVCRGLDADGAVDLPKNWRATLGARQFEGAYRDKPTKRKVEIAVSKVRGDLKKAGVIPTR